MKKQFTVGFFVVGPIAFAALWLLVAVTSVFDEIMDLRHHVPIVQDKR